MSKYKLIKGNHGVVPIYLFLFHFRHSPTFQKRFEAIKNVSKRLCVRVFFPVICLHCNTIENDGEKGCQRSEKKCSEKQFGNEEKKKNKAKKSHTH